MKSFDNRIIQRLAFWKARTDSWLAEETRFQAELSAGLKQSWPAALVLTLLLGPAPVLDMVLGTSIVLTELQRTFAAWTWVPMIFVAFWLFPAIKVAFLPDGSRTDATPAGMWRLIRSNSAFPFIVIGLAGLIAWMIFADRAVLPLLKDLSFLSAVIAIGLTLLAVIADPDKASNVEARDA